ncbi:glycosyltransferase family 4 protein [Pseudanabaena sp. 'Roaring Creek']|uniref:glycosyltransferase family 4 protein n=1 Tax=Pseudanabaena sp. 'Roaring Creek' TaxID=1681830 RepID=UPI0006D8331E|nr:glycosyltransferase family 4 protein [Pseudanabaena sp. 'Roaring Creek']
MKPQILHLLSDRNVGGVMACTNSLINSHLSKKFDFLLLTPDEALSKISVLKPDLMIFHDPPAWKILPLLLRLRFYGKVIIHDHHYSQDFESNNVTTRWRFRLVLTMAYRIATHVVAVSSAQGQWMRDCQFITSNNLSVIQQCRVLEEFLALPIKPFSTRLVLGVYGRFSQQKGIDIFIKSMQDLPDLDVDILIGGYGENQELLYQLANGDRRIQFVGKLADVPKFLANCDVVIIPSRWEPWGNVCVEAKAAAKPVIVTNVDGLPEQIKDCGLIAEPNPDALKDAIAKVVHIYGTSPQTLIDWGNRGRADVRDAWNRYLAEWGQLSERLIEKS